MYDRDVLARRLSFGGGLHAWFHECIVMGGRDEMVGGFFGYE